MTPLRNDDWTVFPDGLVGLGLPKSDPSLYDEDTDQFLDTVLGAERCRHWRDWMPVSAGRIVPVDTALCPAAFLLDGGSRRVNSSAVVGNARLTTIG